MTVRVVTDQGRTLQLGRRLDDGGEGVVYEVDGGSPLVAKLLIQPADSVDLTRRLASLVRRGRSPRMARLLAGEPRRVAWPVATVRVLPRRLPDAHPPDGVPRQENPDIHGFLMPDMRRWFRSLNYLLKPGLRATDFPDATWETSLAAAAGVARLVADVHAAGYVIGDLKPDNLWVDKAANTGISDVDSFQFADGAGFFPCRARTEGYTAPECIISADALPDESADDFVLAVVIYQLLMDGMHPFFGMPADGARYISIDDNILHGRSRLARPGAVRSIAGAPRLSVLPRGLHHLFFRCFDDPGRLRRRPRPTASEWAGALDSERAPGKLRTCQVNPRHVHTAERPWCPWCDAIRAVR